MKHKLIIWLTLFCLVFSHPAYALAPQSLVDSHDYLVEEILSEDSKVSRKAFVSLDRLNAEDMERIINKVINSYNLDIGIEDDGNNKGIVLTVKDSPMRIGFVDVMIDENLKQVMFQNLQIRYDWQQHRLGPLLLRLFAIKFQDYAGYDITSNSVIKNANGSSSAKAWMLGELFKPDLKYDGDEISLIGIFPNFNNTSKHIYIDFNNLIKSAA